MPLVAIPVHVKKSEISSTLNSSLLLTFLMGMYTMIYFGTIYVYLTKKSSKNRLVPAAITMLYISSVTGTVIQWFATNLEFMNRGATRASVFISLYTGPRWLFVVFSASSYTVFVVADALLIWRCFTVWNRLFCAISVPLVFIIAEAGFFLAVIIFHGLYSNTTRPSPATAKTLNDLLSVAFFISFATTLITTTLIAYRIHSASKNGGFPRRRFKHVIDIVVQSGAVYALVLLATAISSIGVGDDILNTRTTALNDYTQAINFPLTGILTTLMVARVALLSVETTFPSTGGQLSGLQFHVGSIQQTGAKEGTESVHTSESGRISDVEAQKGAAKGQQKRNSYDFTPHAI